MAYTVTMRNGQLAIPARLLAEAGLASDAIVTVRPDNGGLMIEPVELELTITEAEQHFPDEWIFIAVSQTDEHGMALGGHIIAHAPGHDAVAEKAREWIKANPGTPNFFLYSGEPQEIVLPASLSCDV